jgi:hypothetical protein
MKIRQKLLTYLGPGWTILQLEKGGIHYEHLIEELRNTYYGRLHIFDDRIGIFADGVEDFGHYENNGLKLRLHQLVRPEQLENITKELIEAGFDIASVMTKRGMDPDSEYDEVGVPFILDSTQPTGEAS